MRYDLDRGHILENKMRSWQVFLVAFFSSATCLGQSPSLGLDCPVRYDSPTPMSLPSLIDEEIIDILRNARRCLEILDLVCAEAVIGDLTQADLDPTALGAFLMVRGDIASLSEDFSAAENAYQNVLGITGLQTQVRQGAVIRLGIVYLRQGRYVLLLRHVSETECDDRSDELAFLEASAYFELDNFSSALTALNRALEVRAVTGGIIPENWHLLQAAIQQATAPDERLCETANTAATIIPTEQCYTAEEFREIEQLGKTIPCTGTARTRRYGVPAIECSGF